MKPRLARFCFALGNAFTPVFGVLSWLQDYAWNVGYRLNPDARDYDDGQCPF